jgi:hypothetical protein
VGVTAAIFVIAAIAIYLRASSMPATATSEEFNLLNSNLLANPLYANAQGASSPLYEKGTANPDA